METGQGDSGVCEDEGGARVTTDQGDDSRVEPKSCKKPAEAMVAEE